MVISLWIAVVIWMITLAIAIVGWMHCATLTSDADNKQMVVGHLIVDPSDLYDGSGVYLQLNVGPETFEDHEEILLEVWVIDSHEKQGR